jgi:hypothetical protein
MGTVLALVVVDGRDAEPEEEDDRGERHGAPGRAAVPAENLAS